MFKQLRKLNWFFKERAKPYAFGIVTLQITNLIAVIPPILIGKAVDNVANTTIDDKKLMIFVIYMILLLISEYIFGYLWSYNIFHNAIIIDLRLRVAMMKKILKMPKPFFEKFSSGDLMSRSTSDIDTLGELLGYGTLAICDSIGYLGANIIAMGMTISWRLTFFAVLPLPILLYLNTKIGDKIYTLYSDQQEALSNMNDEVLENINGVRVVRSYVLEKQSMDNFKKTTDEVFEKSLKTEIVTAIFMPMTKIFTTISYAIAIGYGSILIGQNVITVGELIAFSVYLGYIVWPMFAMGDFINMYGRANTSIERIYEVLEEENELKTDEQVKIYDIKNIKFENYSFQYPKSKTLNLKNIDLQIKKGNTLGIVGRTGSGKSTLIKQILREYVSGTGTLNIDDIKIENIEKNVLNAMIGYVSQENILFSKSVRENILLGKKDATDEEVMNAIQLADFTKDLHTLVDGMNTMVGERGVSISGGQKQRIAIARALIKNPNILILDDSLSAVDSRTQSKIIENIRENRKDKTTIIVTHRLSAVMHADEIVVLDSGKIIEHGTHEQLLAKGGWYNKQYNIQQLEGGKDE